MRTPRRRKETSAASGRRRVELNRLMDAFDRSKSALPAQEPVLDTERFSRLQEALIGEIRQLGSPDEATLWAQRSLPIKNTLLAADATAVESAFAERLSGFARAPSEPLPVPNDEGRQYPMEGPQIASVPKQSSKLEYQGGARPVFPKSIRLRDKEHCKFVANQPCVVCGRVPSDPHHLRFAQPRTLGRKVSDEFTVPLCRVHHRELHRRGDEAAWWQAIKIDPMPLAQKLWRQTRLDRTGVSVSGPET